MKKIAKLFAIVASMVAIGMMTSCTKDNTELIIGTWKVVSVTINGEEITENVPVGETFTFTTDGVVTLTYNYESASAPYAFVDDNTIVLGEVSYMIEKLTKKELKLKDIEEEAVYGGTINLVKI